MILILIFAFFYILWTLFALTHSADFVVAGAMVNWQYSRRRPVVKSAKALLSSHLGSVFMGSYLTVLFGLFKSECAYKT